MNFYFLSAVLVRCVGSCVGCDNISLKVVKEVCLKLGIFTPTAWLGIILRSRFFGWTRYNFISQLLMSTRTVIDNKTIQLTEGKATIIFPGETTVFYNPVQEFNRDLSITVLRQFIKDRQECCESLQNNTHIENPNDLELKHLAKRRRYGGDSTSGVRLLEALAASGLRAIRYAKEVEGIGEILANDMSQAAVECMNNNIKNNNVENIVTPSCKDATVIMHESKTMDKRFDVIDLDPYGSPSHFLDATIQAISEGGLLMVTCTDLATLCGNTPEASFAKYGSMSLKSKASHEILAGPIWSANIHDFNFVNRMLDTLKVIDDDKKLQTHQRIFGLLNVVGEELPDVPLFYLISRLANIIHCPVPNSSAFRSAIINAGYRVSFSHVNPNSVKTDAPMEVLWDIMRCWAKQFTKSDVLISTPTNFPVAVSLLNIEPKLVADFTVNSAAESTSQKEGILRFQPKIHKNWGPKSRAKGSIRSINAACYVPKQESDGSEDMKEEKF